jgi:hypothetical protein
MATLPIRRFLVFLFPEWILYVASLRRPVGREKVLYSRKAFR